MRQLRAHQTRLMFPIAAVISVLVVLFGGIPAGAAPTPTPSASTDFETGSGKEASLKATLEEINRAYNNANGRYNASLTRRKELDAQIAENERRRTQLAGDVEVLAVQAYKGGRVAALSELLDSRSVGEFAGKAAFLDQLARTTSVTLGSLSGIQAELDTQRGALQKEIATIETERATMAARKAEAQKALDVARNTAARSSRSGERTGSTGSGTASAAPRNPDGSYPEESCSVNDPTGTGGCITPRSANALSEARKAGFTRYTKCWRTSSGDHGAGRACDYAASSSGYGTTASGANKSYGDSLAQFFINNASRLGVVYVIWYRRIWMPSTGWEAYDRSGGPSDVHTDHVHLSVQ